MDAGQRVLRAIIAELLRQAQRGALGPHVDVDDPKDAVIDGRIDLTAVAHAVARELEDRPSPDQASIDRPDVR